MMKTIFFSVVMLLSTILWSQDDGALTLEDLQYLRESFQITPSEKAIKNALADHRIKDLAVDRMTRISQNEFFTHKIDVKGVTNQKSSGRCWLFAGLNILRPQMIKKYDLEEFEFSQSYLFFYDKLEKANLFINQIIEWRDRDPDERELTWLLNHVIGDGGQWNMVVDLVEKYGLVPQYAMPETFATSHTHDVNMLLGRKLRQTASRIFNAHNSGVDEAEFDKIRMDTMEDIYRVLVLTFGTPPDTFIWQYENKNNRISKAVRYTPKQFANEVAKTNIAEYVYLLSDPLLDYYQTYIISLDRDMYDKPDMFILNLPIGDLKMLAMEQVLDDDPVWFGCDVGKEMLGKDGAMVLGIYDYESLFGIDFSLTREEQLLYRGSIPTHAMVFVGLDIQDKNPRQWLVENSWGDKKGREGYWTMDDAWFDKYLYGVIIHQKYLTREMEQALEIEPIVLPPWDPMWMMIKGY